MNFIKNLNPWKIATAFVFIVIAILMLSEWLSGTKDGFYEEMTEDIIEHHTGIDIDLSPGYYD